MTDHKIGIYTINNCKYCQEAKSLLNIKKIDFKEQKIDSADEREQLKKKYPNARSFPVIIIDGEWIGGYSNLQEWLRKLNENI